MSMRRVNSSKEKLRYASGCTNFSFERDRKCGFSWPQRNYTCSFCKREFKSAQALGGHMNVHRKDRAKLRKSPSCHCPITQPSPSPNPNPNFSSPSSPAPHFLPHICYSSLFPSFASCVCLPIADSAKHGEKAPQIVHFLYDALGSPQHGHTRKKMSIGGFLGEEELKGFAQQDDQFRVLKKKGIVQLDLNTALIQDSKDDLDLELRLGYS